MLTKSDRRIVREFQRRLADVVPVLPIGDNFTMGPQDALKAVELVNPKIVVPIHYNTFEIIEQDPNAFAQMVEAQTLARCVVLEPGESLTV